MEFIGRVYAALGWAEPPPLDPPDQPLCDFWKNNGGFDLRFNTIHSPPKQRECAAILDRVMLSVLRVYDFRAHPETTPLEPNEELIVLIDDPRYIALALRVAGTWRENNKK